MLFKVIKIFYFYERNLYSHKNEGKPHYFILYIESELVVLDQITDRIKCKLKKISRGVD